MTVIQKPIINTLELINAFEQKAVASSLKIDCPADGLFNSQIAIVAEAPGEREVVAKSPLVGGSGTLLWNSLRNHKLNRNDCYITNVSKRQVAFDTDDRRAPLGKHEFELWAELLRWELAQLPNLRFVVALGGYALKALTGHDGITDWRGSVIPVTLSSFSGVEHSRPKLVSVIASFNPASVLRNPKDQLTFEMDMGRVRRVIDGRWKEHNINAIINPGYDDIRDFLRELQRSREPVAYDIETMGGETSCVGVANNPNEGMCINFRTHTEHRFTIDQELSIRHSIQDLLSDDNVPLIAQNGMFDGSWLWFKDKIKVNPLWIDTMLAHHTLYPMLPHGLGFLCTQYTTHPFYKDERESWKEGGDIDGYWRYNVKDCCITWQVAQRELKELKAQQLDEFFFSHVMKLQPHLIRMTVGGIKIDMEKRKAVNESVWEDLESVKAQFFRAVHEATGDSDYYPNPLSSYDLSDLLFNRLRLVGRGASTDAENRERMYKDARTTDSSRRVLGALNKYKEDQKFFSTYVDTEIDDDGRMRCEWKQTGVKKAPGRLSSAKVLWGHYDTKSKKVVQHGMNLQNQPSRAHEMFICDNPEDYSFIYFDLSQAEAWYVAYDAEIEEWIEQHQRKLLDREYDTHRALASVLYNMPYNDVPARDEENGVKTIRYIAKRCRHGLNYRMQPDRLASTAGLSLGEAQKAFALYHRKTPRLSKNWWPSLEKQARETRYLYNSFGRRLFIQGRLDDPDTLESIVAFRPQSTIGDKVCKVIYQCEQDPRWPSTAAIRLNIHDALVGLAPIEEAEHCLSIMKEYAEEPIIVKPSMPPLIIPAECGVGLIDAEGQRRWSTIQKVKDLDQVSKMLKDNWNEMRKAA